MKRTLLGLLVAVTLVSSSCALWSKFISQTPIQIASDIVVAAEWGVSEAHDVEYLDANDWAQFLKVDALVRDVIAANPQTPRAAAYQVLVAFMAHELPADSKLTPYLKALADALNNPTRAAE